MSQIEISNLAGANLLQGAESFLTELKTTDSKQIYGGGGSKCYGGGKNTPKKKTPKKNTGKKGCGYGGGFLGD